MALHRPVEPAPFIGSWQTFRLVCAEISAMVSNFIVHPSRPRDAINALLVATVSGVLYRYWLNAPVLRHLSMGQWRSVAFGVVVVIGVVLVRIGLNNLAALACSSVVGLFLGGTWAALEVPTLDVTSPISTEPSQAFGSNLTLWREIALLTIAVTLGGLLSRFVNRRKS